MNTMNMRRIPWTWADSRGRPSGRKDSAYSESCVKRLGVADCFLASRSFSIGCCSWGMPRRYCGVAWCTSTCWASLRAGSVLHVINNSTNILQVGAIRARQEPNLSAPRPARLVAQPCVSRACLVASPAVSARPAVCVHGALAVRVFPSAHGGAGCLAPQNQGQTTGLGPLPSARDAGAPAAAAEAARQRLQQKNTAPRPCGARHAGPEMRGKCWRWLRIGHVHTRGWDVDFQRQECGRERLDDACSRSPSGPVNAALRKRLLALV